MRYRIAIIAALASGPALAQHAGHVSGTAHSPYAGLAERAVKALFGRADRDLRAGRGCPSLCRPN